MKPSDDRILTTHTGSLPRGRELTALYANRQKGEAVDAAEIARLGQEAVRKVVSRQAAAGIDIGNDGEQMKDGFFLYLQQRLTGLGGSWQRAAARATSSAIRNSSACWPSRPQRSR